jgi:hypothetical protein
MPLQNRVNPLGEIIRTTARGSIMGNRGVIHSEAQAIVRPYKLKAWITCVLEYKGKWRKVMTPNRWTELFFLDEATAFAAGHRPCAECRRSYFNHFKQSWLKGNPEYGFNSKTSIKEIDAILHAERMNKDGSKKIFELSLGEIPTGCFVLYKNECMLVKDHLLFPWTAHGYNAPIDIHKKTKLQVLTPLSIVNTFKAGYTPMILVN